MATDDGVQAHVTDLGWDDTPQTVDLANSSSASQTPPLDSELGSAMTWADSLFIDYLDPAVGAIPYWEAKDYALMLKTDGQARKVEQVLTLPLLSVPFNIEPGKGDAGEAETITELLTRPANAGGMSTPLRLVVAQMCSAITFRVASFEKVFTQVDIGGKTRVGYGKLAFRPATSTRVLRDRKTGGYRGIEQDPIEGGLPIRIPAARAFTYVHGQHREPVLGLSDMEVALTCWRTKQKLRFLWFLFLEARALPKVTTESTGTEQSSHDMTKSAAKQLAKLRGGGVVGMPPGVSAQVLESSGRAAEYYEKALAYLDSEMTGSVLAQFADLASMAASGRGSLALSADQSDLFLQSRQAIHREMEEQFTNYVIADLVRYNFGPSAAVPRLKFAPLNIADLSTLVQALGSLAGKPGIPGEFVGFLVESAAELLHVNPDKVAAMVDKATAQAEAAAKNAQQAQVAKAAAPVAAITHAVQQSPAAREVVGHAQSSGVHRQ